MAAGRGDMRDVELVEVVDGREIDDEPSLGASGPRPPRRLPASTWSPQARARLRNAVAVVLSVGLLVAGIDAVVVERRQVARLEALADVPGVLAPLSGPVRELWSTDGFPVSPIDAVGGLLVTVLLDRSAPTLDAVGLDPLSGQAVWRTPLRESVREDVPVQCVVPGAPYRDLQTDDAPVVACVIADEYETTTEAVGHGSVAYAVRARLVVLDALTGRLVRDVEIDPSTTVGGIGPDLVLGTVDADGRPRVARTDSRSGEERWVFTGPDRVPADGSGLRRVWVYSEHEVVLAHAGSTWAISADGEVLHELTGSPNGGHVQVLSDGRTVAQLHEDAEPSTELVDLETGRSTTHRGYLTVPVPDDGSLPDLLLVRAADGGGISAVDVGTGRTRWTVDGHDDGPPIVLDGRVITVHGGSLEALDGTTGAVIWSARPDGMTPGPAVTDGVLVLAGSTTGTESGVVAFDLDDGREVWSAELGTLPYLFSNAGRLFGYSDLGITALGADDAGERLRADGPHEPPARRAGTGSSGTSRGRVRRAASAPAGRAAGSGP